MNKNLTRPAFTGASTDQSTFRTDRIVGVLVGTACGDALGAPHEFGPPIPFDVPLVMSGGGPFGFAPGEYTDDTAMAIPIAQAVAAGADLNDKNVIAGILQAWIDWLAVTKDVGAQTGSILRQLLKVASDVEGEITLHRLNEARCRDLSKSHHARSGRSAGNGALMRTAPVALGFLKDAAGNYDAEGLTRAARRIAELTHWESTAAEACILWCHAIVHAIHTGEFDVRVGIDWIPAESRDYWLEIIDVAEKSEPADFAGNNGWVVAALQGAWSAICTGQRAGEGAVGMIERAVRGGGDTDTVAAIAGGLVGAAFGVSAIPAEWRRTLHGWPGLDYRDLLNLGVLAATGGKSGQQGWPTAERWEEPPRATLVPHPFDDGVWIGSIDAIDRFEEVAGKPADAVISLCRVGARQTGSGAGSPEQIEFWLIDIAGANQDPVFLLSDVADTVAQLRGEDKTVLIHCVAAHSRTPSAAIAYAVRHLGVGVDEAQARIEDALPEIHHNRQLVNALRHVQPASPIE
jgi:ADP-ribosylglycohydrolase/predicted protein tyrosine phosphatase